jgi:membrane associated rhomboid family serine protease
MTDYKLNAEPGRYEVKGSSLSATVTRGAESWQFLAFVFAALVALAFALIDDIAARNWWRLGVKLAAFAVVGYLTLFDPKVRNWLVGFLSARIKVERH